MHFDWGSFWSLIVWALFLFCRWIFCRWASYVLSSDGLDALAEDHFNDVISNTLAIITAAIAVHTPLWWFDPAGAIFISVVIILRWIGMMNEQVVLVLFPLNSSSITLSCFLSTVWAGQEDSRPHSAARIHRAGGRKNRVVMHHFRIFIWCMTIECDCRFFLNVSLSYRTLHKLCWILQVEVLAKGHDQRLAVDCTRAYHFGARCEITFAKIHSFLSFIRSFPAHYSLLHCTDSTVDYCTEL